MPSSRAKKARARRKEKRRGNGPKRRRASGGGGKRERERERPQVAAIQFKGGYPREIFTISTHGAPAVKSYAVSSHGWHCRRSPLSEGNAGRSRSRRQMAAAIGNESSRVALTARRSRVGSAATRARAPKGKGFFSYEEKRRERNSGLKLRIGGGEIFNLD